MRRVTSFTVSGENYKDLMDAAKGRWKDLYGEDLEELPWDAEVHISEADTTHSPDGSVVTRWEASVIIRHNDKGKTS